MESIKCIIFSIFVNYLTLSQVPEFELAIRTTSEAEEIYSTLFTEAYGFDSAFMATDFESGSLLILGSNVVHNQRIIAKGYNYRITILTCTYSSWAMLTSKSKIRMLDEEMAYTRSVHRHIPLPKVSRVLSF